MTEHDNDIAPELARKQEGTMEPTRNTEETTTERRMIELPNFSYSPEVQAKMVERYKALRWQLETLDLFAPSTQEAHEDAKGNLQVEASGLLDFALSMAQQVHDLTSLLVREREGWQKIAETAAGLYDNRLGWSDGRNPYAPSELWDALGAALGRDPAGFCSAASAQSAPSSAESITVDEFIHREGPNWAGVDAQTYVRSLREGDAPARAEVVERLREALEWYAEPSIYQQEHFEGTGMEYPALVDGGHTARAALAAAEAQP